jgi:2-hydroxy-3-oxopropionate reductase
VHIGDHGAGQVSKACNQILAAQTVAAVGEAFLLAKSSGVDPNKVRDALLGGFANSKVLELHGKRILDNNYKPGFKAELHFKDIGIALKSAQENNISIPGTEMVEKYLRKLVEQGDGELDSAAIAKIVLGE